MWFKRKTKNRRASRPRNVLDVKVRSSQIRAARLRLGAVALGAFFGTVFGVYLLWRAGEWAMEQFVYENPSFAIRKINVQTDGVIAADQLRRWSGVRLGQNLLALDLGRVKRDLQLSPMISSVSVERILPSTLCIRVTERQPVAQINVPHPRAGGGIELVVYQVDANGYVMTPLDPRQRAVPLSAADRLPELLGVNFSDLQPGRQIESPQVHAALRFIAAFESAPLADYVKVTQVDVSSPEVLVATTSQGSRITLGLDSFGRQLARWQEIYQLGLGMNRVLATLDLAVPNNIPARWLEASDVPPSLHTKPRVQRTGKRNV